MDNAVNSQNWLLPYPVIAAAVRGEPKAVNAVMRHYSAYIAVLSSHVGRAANGGTCIRVNDELSQRLKSRLLATLVEFQLH